jgi:toxin-antitoxin system PIN domain toxin
MLIPDVNVLVAAYRDVAEHHEQARPWLESALSGPEPVGVTDAVLAGVVRVVTNPRIFRPPTATARAVEQMSDVRSATQLVRPGRGWWSIFARLCEQVGARGPLVADAAHAATAIEAGATWVTFDRDFARFPGLRWRTP